MPTGTAKAKETGEAKAKRNRAKSPFTPQRRLTVATHNDAKGVDLDMAARAIAAAYADTYAVRIAQRDRREGASDDAPVSTMVYIAPKGHVWAAEVERGIRLSADTAAKLRAVVGDSGMSLDDLVKSLLAKAANG